MNRLDPVAGPIILIAVGLLLLLNNFDLLPLGFWGTLGRLWPLALVIFGIDWIWGRSRPWLAAVIGVAIIGAAVALAVAWAPASRLGGFTNRLVQPLDNLESAQIEIEFGAGTLDLGALEPASPNLLEGDFGEEGSGDGAVKSFRRQDGVGILRLEVPSGVRGAQRWQAQLSPRLPLSIRLKAGAAEVILRLTSLRVRQLTLEVGASRAQVTLPASGETSVLVKAGVADVTLEVPSEVAARTKADTGLTALQVDTSRFPRQGDYYISPRWEASSNRADITIEAGVGRVAVR